MTPELKAEWIAKLKTYPKTKGNPKDDRGYCCLGVLLDIAGGGFSDHKDLPGVLDEASDVAYAVNNHNMACGQELTKYALETFGFERATHDYLTNLNDTSDTFDPVIEYIEANL